MRHLGPTLLVAALACHAGPAADAQAAMATAPDRQSSQTISEAQTASHFDISPPLREMSPRKPRGFWTPFDMGDASPSTSTTAALDHEDGAVQGSAGIATMPSTTVNFAGMANTFYSTPGPSADVGPNHYVVMSNAGMQVFDKSGNSLMGPVDNSTIWANTGAVCLGSGGILPSVLYDQLSDRWLLATCDIGSPNYALFLAVSVTGDPLGSYYRWVFDLSNLYPDGPIYGAWSDAFYMSCREFTNGTTDAGIRVRAFNRADVIAGLPNPRVVTSLIPNAVSPYTFALMPADLDGTTLPPTGSPALFVGATDQGGPYFATQDALTLWRYHADFATPANSTFTLASTLPVATFDTVFPCPGGGRRCIPQPGATTSQYLAFSTWGAGQSVMPRVTYRNFGTHQSLVCSQSVEAAPGIAGIRWYEVRDPGGTPVVHQQGTYAPGVTDGIQRWNGSIAMDRVGDIALGYSASSATVFPSVYYTGRLAADPLGSMPQGEGVIINGTGIQQSTNNYWGYYSNMSVDPADDCTFWYVNQYYPVSSSIGWRLRVGAFKFPGCTSQVGVQDGQSPRSATRLEPMGLARGQVDIHFTLAGSESRRVRLEVLDVSGRRVRHLLDASLAGGGHNLMWDRRSDAGESMRPGVYHVRLRAGDEEQAKGVILVQ